MMTFDQLQQRKVSSAAALLKKLVDIRPRLFQAEQLGKNELVVQWLQGYAAALGELADTVTEQKKLCKSDQCNTLLDDEVTALDNAVRHINQVIKGVELNEAKVRAALITITSRQHSLEQLRKAA